MARDEPVERDAPDGVRIGLQRAKLHWMRAGYEVLAGLGALLEELVPRKDADEEDGEEAAPTHIELED